MLQHLKELPPYVAGFKASGKITWDDFKNVAIPAIDKVAGQYRQINFLMLLETDIGNMTAGAWTQDMITGIKHLSKWNRMAIVSDQENVRSLSEAAGKIMPGEVKAYPLSDLEAAKAWVSAVVPEKEEG